MNILPEWLTSAFFSIEESFKKNVRAVAYFFGYKIDDVKINININNVLDEFSDKLCGRWLVQEWNFVTESVWETSGHFYVAYKDRDGTYHGQMILQYRNKDGAHLSDLKKSWWIIRNYRKSWDFEARYYISFNEVSSNKYSGKSEMVEKYPPVGSKAFGVFDIEYLGLNEIHGVFRNTGPSASGYKSSVASFVLTNRIRWRDLDSM